MYYLCPTKKLEKFKAYDIPCVPKAKQMTKAGPSNPCLEIPSPSLVRVDLSVFVT